MRAVRLKLLLHTVWYLRFGQLCFQLWNRVVRHRYIQFENKEGSVKVVVSPITKPKCLVGENKFRFLNIESGFSSWNDMSNGALWAYNLNYMDWLCQEGIAFKEGAEWIERFISDLPQNKVGLDPYPIALRCINWIKFISCNALQADQETLSRWNDSLYSQYALLVKKLEYHLLGNHLLEDAYSLFIGAIYFRNKHFWRKARKLLCAQLGQQILKDGAHYEQSPMYHCILLDRLLDCYNFSAGNVVFEKQDEINDLLKAKAKVMLGHLESLVYKDKSVPLVNDSTLGIAPTVTQLFDYASRLGIAWNGVELGDCGYRKFENECLECFIDVGNIIASYQPGHSHADTFNYELRIDAKPFIVDTGISTYNKNSRRQYERSTAAHNTVVVANSNSSEVWGGFRVGKRARIEVLQDSANKIIARHNGYRPIIHTRTFELVDNSIIISDEINSAAEAKSYIHLAPTITVLECTNTIVKTSVADIHIENAVSVNVESVEVSSCYNELQSALVVVISFAGKMSYRICPAR